MATKTEYFIMGILFVLCIGATYYTFNLRDYKEECFEYVKENYTANWSYSDYKDGNYCYIPSGYWGLNCSIVTKYWFYNSTRDSDKCLKYHLVRYDAGT
jgi:hypothetical protein